ncbi:MAG: hypothetical protein ACLR31_21505 [Escherichia coli]
MTTVIIRPDAPLQSVGCLLPERCTPEQLAAMLEAQTPPLTEQGNVAAAGR